MAKVGKPFELVVSDVVSEMDPDAVVRQGVWTEGPDGRRDLDVVVEGTVDGVPRRVQIECRDYKLSRRRIGIGQIDALESKHRDLKMDVSLLCSNAGFSTAAIRKARRSGIGLIGVLRQGDPRIRYRVVDEIYIRRINVAQNSGNFRFDWSMGVPTQGKLRLDEISYSGTPVYNWLMSRIPIFLASNLVVNGTFELSFRFKTPILFDLPFGRAAAKSFSMQFTISGKWIAQRIEIDATCGLYDWIRRTVRISPNAGILAFKKVPIGKGGTKIKCPPDFDPMKVTKLIGGEMWLDILDLGGINIPKEKPPLDQFIVAEDLELRRAAFPPEAYIS